MMRLLILVVRMLRWLLLPRGHGPRIRLGFIPLVPMSPVLWPLLPSFVQSLLSIPFRLGPGDVFSHLHVMGLTGVGKSKLLATYAAELILNGQACAVIDPHTDLTLDVLALLWQRGFYRRADALKRVLFLDFSLPDRFVPFNVLQQPYSSYAIARNLVEACMRAWSSLAGGVAPQFENLLLAAAMVLIQNHLPLTALSRLLTDASFRESLLRNVDDDQVLEFFCARYNTKTGGTGHGGGTGGTGLSESTLRRAFLLTFAPSLRGSLGQTGNILNCRMLMDQRVSVLINLGGLDAQTQRLLGCLLTVSFEEAALSRADMPASARVPYHLFVDEFPMFSSQSEEALERVLSLCRKYGLYCVLAHQSWSQLSSKLAGALQNTAFLAFRLGAEDAEWGASRIGQINPYQVKYVTPTHAVYVSPSEQKSQWAYILSHLRVQEALLRLRNRTIRFTTANVPPASTEVTAAIEHLRAIYATKLLRPAPMPLGGHQDQQMTPSSSRLATGPAHMPIRSSPSPLPASPSPWPSPSSASLPASAPARAEPKLKRVVAL